ncbi:MAG: 50S ribosomal protein L10 [Acidimicrobiia bacterium]|nr:50S ribosomal protein L10 [Acidimicrobiia bacterium]
MPRPEKVQAVEEIKERLEQSRATFLTEYRGLSVSQQQKLRRSLRAAGADFKVVKMTLAKLAAEELGLEIAEELVGPTALAFASDDAVTVAKALRDFAKEHEAFVLKSGLLGTVYLAPEQVTKLADIEPREVLLSKIAGAAKAPMAKMAGMLSSFTRDAASMFSQLLDKKEQDSPAAAPPEVASAADESAPVEDAADDPGSDDTPSEETASEETVSDDAAAEEE